MLYALFTRVPFLNGLALTIEASRSPERSRANIARVGGVTTRSFLEHSFRKKKIKKGAKKYVVIASTGAAAVEVLSAQMVHKFT